MGDLHYPKKVCCVATLEAELIEAGLSKPAQFTGVSSGEAPEEGTTVHIASDLTERKRQLIDSVVAKHSLSAYYRSQRIVELETAVRRYICSRYSIEDQIVLNMLFSESIMLGAKSQTVYLAQWTSWMRSCLAYHHGIVDELTAAASPNEVAAVSWDFSLLDSSDPHVTIREALAIGTKRTAPAHRKRRQRVVG